MVQRDKHMDQANSRLLTAFDPLQNRMFQAAAVLETAIDNILSFIPGYERWSWWSNNVTRLAYAKVTIIEGMVNRGTYGHIQSAACLATKKSVTVAHNKCLNELIDAIIKHQEQNCVYKRGH